MTGGEYEKELERMVGTEKGFMKVVGVKKDGRKSRLIISCACGNKTEMMKCYFLGKNRTSCGCRYGVKAENSHLYKHGKSKTRLNNLYHDIKSRCYSPEDTSYENYGGRGIKMCDEWLGEHGFENFSKWAYSTGYDENAERGKCTIDRIDNDGDYCPENCRWATNKEQCNNKRDNRYITLNGKTLTFREWCDEYGVTPDSVYYRLNKGMDFENALKAPRRKRRKDMTEEEILLQKKKRNEQTKKWIEENKEHVIKKKREWEEKNKDKIREYQKRYEEKKKLDKKKTD